MANYFAGWPTRSLGQAFGVAVVWLVLYVLNDLMFSSAAVTEHLSWFFLPAFIRMLAVMLFGCVGALGIFVGSLCSGWYSMLEPNYISVLTLAGFSAIAPLAAFLLCSQYFSFKRDLRGLSATQLICLGMVSAALTAGIHNLHFSAVGHVDNFWDGFVPMFVGDALGTFAMLYLAKLLVGLALSNQPRTNQSPS
jgi:hypothetical protein